MGLMELGWQNDRERKRSRQDDKQPVAKNKVNM